jgi:UDP-glucuronate decarboxylase
MEPKQIKRCLVTGAYGLVGTAICKQLESYPDIEVTKVKFDEISKYDTEFNYIIHAAGYGQPQMFSKDKLACININTRTTDNLFGWLKPGGKFLFVSTSEVYSGYSSPHKETDIGTTTPQHPRACYIEGKRCGEAICMAYKEQGFDVKITRLALAYGPGTKKGDTRALNQLIEKALTTGEIKLMDKGEAIRTYCYVDDVAQMMLDILFKGKDIVYNVGGTSTLTIGELAVRIGNITNSKVIMGNESLKGAPDDVKLDIRKVLTEFPRELTPIHEGLIKTIEYQKQLYSGNNGA